VQVYLSARCDIASPVLARVAHGDRRLGRTIDLSDVPASARARALALTLAESVRAVTLPTTGESADEGPPPGWVELPPDEAKAPELNEPPAPSAASQPASEASSLERDAGAIEPGSDGTDAPAWAIGATGDNVLFLREPTAMWGGSLRVHVSRLRISGGGLFGNTDDQLGSVRMQLALGRVAYDIKRWRAGDLTLLFAPRFGFGITWVQATAGSNAVSIPGREPYVEVGAEVASELPLANRWNLLAGFGFGYASGVSLTADGRDIAQIGGGLASFLLGVNYHALD
jgi:hypothetical protein